MAWRFSSPRQQAATASGQREARTGAGVDEKRARQGQDGRSSLAPPEVGSGTSQESALMFDLAALAIAIGCFLVIFLLLYVLERV
jgi:hypothetical protein